jgi:hypothetical protein
LCEAYGNVQPEYVEVPDKLLSLTRELAEAETHNEKEEGLTSYGNTDSLAVAAL